MCVCMFGSSWPALPEDRPGLSGEQDLMIRLKERKQRTEQWREREERKRREEKNAFGEEETKREREGKGKE